MRISLGVEVHSCQELGPCYLCPLADGWPRSSSRGRTPAQPGHRFCFEAGGDIEICTCPLLLASGPVSCPSSEALRGSGAGPRGSRPLWRHSGRRRRQRGGVLTGWMAGGAPGAKPPPTKRHPPGRPGVGAGDLPLLTSRALGPFRPPRVPGSVVGRRGTAARMGSTGREKREPSDCIRTGSRLRRRPSAQQPPFGGAHLRGVSVSDPRSPPTLRSVCRQARSAFIHACARLSLPPPWTCPRAKTHLAASDQKALALAP